MRFHTSELLTSDFLTFLHELLAHAWLSFGHPGVLVGNMISDHVKGKARYDYPSEVQAGIALHRLIDEFTDTHPATTAAKKFFRAEYRLYAAPVTDIIYDHFLARDERYFTDESLLAFTQQVYGTLQSYAELLPPRFLAMLPHMTQHN
ncbi:MAG: DUF479 domain-containing protein, partial [Sphingobacteriales bacterium]